MSKTYQVNFSYTVYGTAVHIEADNPEQAEQWLFNEMEQNGIEEFEHKINDRDYEVNTAKEVTT